LGHGTFDAGEQRAEVVVAGHDRCGGGVGGCIDELPPPFPFPCGDVPAESGEIGANRLRLLLEGDEHATIAGGGDARGQELCGEDGLGGAGGACDECGAACGESAAADFVEPGDSGAELVNPRGPR